MTQLAELQKSIADLVGEFGSIHNTDYVMQLITTSLELGSDKTSTLDLKIASSALKEMREAFAMFQPFTQRRKVTIFGSARTKKDDPLYSHTQNVAKSLADEGWMVVTGAGPGIMEAGMEGAGRERSIGVSIRLPFESSANSIIAGDEKYVSMRYFFTRKLMLVKESQAFCVYRVVSEPSMKHLSCLRLLRQARAFPCRSCCWIFQETAFGTRSMN